MAVLPFASQGQIRQEIDKLTQWISTLTVSTSVMDSTHGKAANKGQPASVAVKLPLPSTMRRHNNILNEEENDMFSEAIENDDVFKLKELLNCGSLVAVKCKSHADQVNVPLICISKIRKPRPISPLFFSRTNFNGLWELYRHVMLFWNWQHKEDPSIVLNT